MIALVLAMVWSRRGQAATLALLSLFGVAAAVGAPAYLRAADRAAASGQVAVAVPAERAVALTVRQPDSRQDNSGVPVAGSILDTSGTSLVELPGFDYVYSTEIATVGIEEDNRNQTRLVYRQDVCPHLRVTAGRCLIGEGDIMLGARTAQRLGIRPGDSISLSYATFAKEPELQVWVAKGVAKPFLVAGTYEVSAPEDVYWGSRNYFGSGEPVFVSNASAQAMDYGDIDLGIDGYAKPGALGVDRLPALRTGLQQLQQSATMFGNGVQLTTRIPDLLARIDSGRTAAHLLVPVLAVALVLLACLTIFLAVGYGTEGRRPELAVVALRGARRGQRWWLATGENLVAIVAGAVAGCVAAQLMVNAFAAWRFPGVGADPGLDSLRWAPVAAGAAVLTALLAERRQLTTPVTELLRRAPVVPGSAVAIAAEVVLVGLAVVATVQLTTGGGLRGVGTFATALILIAGALVAGRLLLPWTALFARRTFARGRLGIALAGFQLARRPGAVRLFALLTAAVAVAGYAACAVDVAARGRTEQAVLGTGAARVVSVGPVGRQGLLTAVRAVDPDGAFAMAAIRYPDNSGLAVDTTRLAAVAAWPPSAPGAPTVAAALHPSEPVSFQIADDQVLFDITTSGFTLGKAVTVLAVLSPVDGLSDEVLPLGVLRNGRDTYGRKVPACAHGCILNSLRIAGGTGSVDVAGEITIHRLGGVALTDPSRWRASEGGRIGTAPDGLRIDVLSLNGLAAGMIVEPADTPYPLPVAVAGRKSPTSLTGLDAAEVPVTVAARLPVVPGFGAPGLLTDLDYADRLSTDGAQSNTAQVWLGPRAPADILRRLEQRGLTVTADTEAAQVRRRLDAEGPAVALWFYLIVAVLAAALAAGTLVLAATVDRARRVEDLTALRTQGLPRSALRQATLWTYPVLVALAVVAGTGITLLAWRLTGSSLPLAGLDPTAFPLPGRPSWPVVAGTGAAVFVLLTAVAILTGRRTLRAIP